MREFPGLPISGRRDVGHQMLRLFPVGPCNLHAWLPLHFLEVTAIAPLLLIVLHACHLVFRDFRDFRNSNAPLAFCRNDNAQEVVSRRDNNHTENNHKGHGNKRKTQSLHGILPQDD